FGKRDELLARAGCARAAAGNDDRSLGLLQDVERSLYVGGFGLGTERRRLGELRLDQSFHFGFFEIDLAFVTAELQMHRAWRAGSRDAEGLPDHVRNARAIVDR